MMIWLGVRAPAAKRRTQRTYRSPCTPGCAALVQKCSRRLTCLFNHGRSAPDDDEYEVPELPVAGVKKLGEADDEEAPKASKGVRFYICLAPPWSLGTVHM